MRRFALLLIVSSLVVAALMPQTAAAAAPIRFVGTPFTGSFAAGSVCAFQVDTAPVVFNAVVTVFLDGAGNVTRIHVSGYVAISLTNQATGKTLVFNASGPASEFPHADGSATVASGGPSLFALGPADDRGPGLLYTTGRATFTVSPTGQISNLSILGPVENVCAALAA